MKNNVMLTIAQQTAQQGDITFQKLNVRPVGKKKLLKPTTKGFVLSRGSATGSHIALCDKAYVVDDKLYIESKKIIKIVHNKNEHKSFDLSPGIWIIGHLDEYDYFSQMKRQIID